LQDPVSDRGPDPRVDREAANLQEESGMKKRGVMDAIVGVICVEA
jgi:hypothetical protein